MFEPQLSISKLGGIKLGSTTLSPDDLMASDWLRWVVTTDLQDQFPDHSIWLVGETLSTHGFQCHWTESEQLARYLKDEQGKLA